MVLKTLASSSIFSTLGRFRTFPFTPTNRLPMGPSVQSRSVYHWSMFLFGVLLLLFLGIPGLAKRHPEPARRCCSPDHWEADVKLIGSTSRIRDPSQRISGKFTYDYYNRRWAFDYRDSGNRTNNQKIVFDHKANLKYVMFHEGCFKVPLNADMDRYCIPGNATHHGLYETTLGKTRLAFDVWSYDMFMRPVRSLFKISRDTCLPLQESSYGLYKNYFALEEGEPICNPWAHHAQVRSGECFRSHVRRKKEVQGARPSAFITNMDFRNSNSTHISHEIFKIPAECQPLDDWPANMTWNEFWYIFIMRRKKN